MKLRQRLWRCTHPNLDEETRSVLVKALMAARRGVKVAKGAGDQAALKAARESVNQAKISLGERGPIWWDDDSDFNQHRVNSTPYAEWWSSQS